MGLDAATTHSLSSLFTVPVPVPVLLHTTSCTHLTDQVLYQPRATPGDGDQCYSTGRQVSGASFQPLEVASCCPGPNSPNNHETACCSAASRGNALSRGLFLRMMIPDGHETPDGPPFTLSLSCCFTALHCHLALQGTIHTGLHAELSHLGAYIGGRLGGRLSS